MAISIVLTKLPSALDSAYRHVIIQQTFTFLNNLLSNLNNLFNFPLTFLKLTTATNTLNMTVSKL